jgi:hypothetical protein
MRNKKSLSQTVEAIRKRKSRDNENINKCQTCLASIRENKKRKIDNETVEQYASQLAKNREQKQRERRQRILEPADECLNCQDEQFTDNFQTLSESDRKFLGKFCTEMNKFEHKACPVCNERFPLINLVLGMCRRCYNDKGVKNDKSD